MPSPDQSETGPEGVITVTSLKAMNSAIGLLQIVSTGSATEEREHVIRVCLRVTAKVKVAEVCDLAELGFEVIEAGVIGLEPGGLGR